MRVRLKRFCKGGEGRDKIIDILSVPAVPAADGQGIRIYHWHANFFSNIAKYLIFSNESLVGYLIASFDWTI